MSVDDPSVCARSSASDAQTSSSTATARMLYATRRLESVHVLFQVVGSDLSRKAMHSEASEVCLDRSILQQWAFPDVRTQQ